MRYPNKFAESSGPNNSYVWESVLVFWMALPLLHIITGETNGVCVPVCVCVRAGAGDTTVWALWNFIRIQHTACKMQQMASSLEWQLRVCCHPELQLACQSKAAPRSFLHIRMFHLSSTSPSFFPFPSFNWHRLSCPITFYVFDLSIWLLFSFISFSRALSFLSSSSTQAKQKSL